MSFFNCDKVLIDLNWHSTLGFEDTVKMTVEWYKEYYHNKTQSMHDFTISQIEVYIESAKLDNIAWTDND